jgi:hypothetical protein
MIRSRCGGGTRFRVRFAGLCWVVLVLDAESPFAAPVGLGASVLRETPEFCDRATVEADETVFARSDLRNDLEPIEEWNLLMNVENFPAF